MVTAERGMTCLSRQTAGADGYCRRGYDLPVEGGRQQTLVVTAEREGSDRLVVVGEGGQQAAASQRVPDLHHCAPCNHTTQP